MNNLSKQLLSRCDLAYVEAGWHSDILAPGKEAFAQRMREHGMSDNRIHYFSVPGAFEIPLLVRRLALSGRYRAIAGAAFVVDGGIYRHDFVAAAVVEGLMRVQLEADVPVFSMVLTPHHFHEHSTHRQFFKDHFSTKGRELADACIQQLISLDEFEKSGVGTLA